MAILCFSIWTLDKSQNKCGEQNLFLTAWKPGDDTEDTKIPFCKAQCLGRVSGALLQEGLPSDLTGIFCKQKSTWKPLKFTENHVLWSNAWWKKTFLRYKHVVEMGTTHKLDHEATSAFQPNLPLASWYPAGWMSSRDLEGPYTQGESSKMIFKGQQKTCIYLYIIVYSCIWVARESLQLDLTFGGWRYCFFNIKRQIPHNKTSLTKGIDGLALQWVMEKMAWTTWGRRPWRSLLHGSNSKSTQIDNGLSTYHP